MTVQDSSQDRWFQSSPSSCYSLLLKFCIWILSAHVSDGRYLPIMDGGHFWEQLCYHFKERPHNSSVKTRNTTSFMLTWSGQLQLCLCNFFNYGTERVGEWLWRRSLDVLWNMRTRQHNPMLLLCVIITEKMHLILLLLLSHHSALSMPGAVPSAFCVVSRFTLTATLRGKGDDRRYHVTQHSCS